ncbi:hypothetical protein DUI87_09304 [Hirundo rustica rustica]|uniref:Uncharacterized protein n=1 Tax=Hirundo rustica rustica TaxID=333673 RepID=A0A3M0KME7_HIRRU|nr:hypothetical protein DUI87_09304 [Hirundo rustica rustica]
MDTAEVQHLALALVGLHEILMDPLLKFVQVALDDIPSFCSIYCLDCVICKLAERALDITVYVIDQDIKEHQSQESVQGNTCYWCPIGHGAIDHNSGCIQTANSLFNN